MKTILVLNFSRKKLTSTIERVYLMKHIRYLSMPEINNNVYKYKKDIYYKVKCYE